MTEKQQSQLNYWTKIAIEVGLVLFAIGVAWATMQKDVAESIARTNKQEIAVAKEFNKHDSRIAICEAAISNMQADVREIRVEQKYISQGIDEIKKGMK